MVLKNRLREVMLLKRVTQEELSRRTGIPRSDISRIINDQKEIYLSTAKRIAKALGYSVDFLWPD
ncbi:MAG: helix-turn-helix domain-containing protein [Desulfitobacteriaceae bacterium]